MLDVAQTLGISPATVKNHLDAIFDKMGVRSAVELAQLLTARTPKPE